MSLLFFRSVSKRGEITGRAWHSIKLGLSPASDRPSSPHIPVMVEEVCHRFAAHLRPRKAESNRIIVDASFGAGGHANELLRRCPAISLVGIDRDPLAGSFLQHLSEGHRIKLLHGRFSQVRDLIQSQVEEGVRVSGVLFDAGVSSMQLETAERGFSFLRDGPLDMRMDNSSTSKASTAWELIAHHDSEALSDLIFSLSQEPASRKIAAEIKKALASQTLKNSTASLADLVRRVKTRVGAKPDPFAKHPATQTFQALRMAVNEELFELAQGLIQAQELLEPGGMLAVLTFHSLEDSLVKEFFYTCSGRTDPLQCTLSYFSCAEKQPPSLIMNPRKPIQPSAQEIHRNPRSRSAKLRMAIRTATPPLTISAEKSLVANRLPQKNLPSRSNPLQK